MTQPPPFGKGFYLLSVTPHAPRFTSPPFLWYTPPMNAEISIPNDILEQGAPTAPAPVAAPAPSASTRPTANLIDQMVLAAPKQAEAEQVTTPERVSNAVIQIDIDEVAAQTENRHERFEQGQAEDDADLGFGQKHYPVALPAKAVAVLTREHDLLATDHDRPSLFARLWGYEIKTADTIADDIESQWGMSRDSVAASLWTQYQEDLLCEGELRPPQTVEG